MANYVVMESNDLLEVRLYNPMSRTVFVAGEPNYVHFPHILFGQYKNYHRNYKFTELYAGICLEDISKWDKENLKYARVYRMPFPSHFYTGQFGPCCMSTSYFSKDFNNLIDEFWFTGFSTMGYGCSLNDLSTERFVQRLKKLSSPFWSYYPKFINFINEDEYEDFWDNAYDEGF